MWQCQLAAWKNKLQENNISMIYIDPWSCSADSIRKHRQILSFFSRQLIIITYHELNITTYSILLRYSRTIVVIGMWMDKLLLITMTLILEYVFMVQNFIKSITEYFKCWYFKIAFVQQLLMLSNNFIETRFYQWYLHILPAYFTPLCTRLNIMAQKLIMELGIELLMTLFWEK